MHLQEFFTPQELHALLKCKWPRFLFVAFRSNFVKSPEYNSARVANRPIHISKYGAMSNQETTVETLRCMAIFTSKLMLDDTDVTKPIGTMN